MDHISFRLGKILAETKIMRARTKILALGTRVRLGEADPTEVRKALTVLIKQLDTEQGLQIAEALLD